MTVLSASLLVSLAGCGQTQSTEALCQKNAELNAAEAQRSTEARQMYDEGSFERLWSASTAGFSIPDKFRQLAAVAPDEIRSDIEILAEGTEQALGAGASGDLSSMFGSALYASLRLDAPMKRFTQYMVDNCNTDGTVVTDEQRAQTADAARLEEERQARIERMREEPGVVFADGISEDVKEYFVIGDRDAWSGGSSNVRVNWRFDAYPLVPTYGQLLGEVEVRDFDGNLVRTETLERKIILQELYADNEDTLEVDGTPGQDVVLNVVELEYRPFDLESATVDEGELDFYVDADDYSDDVLVVAVWSPYSDWQDDNDGLLAGVNATIGMYSPDDFSMIEEADVVLPATFGLGEDSDIRVWVEWESERSSEYYEDKLYRFTAAEPFYCAEDEDNRFREKVPDGNGGCRDVDRERDRIEWRAGASAARSLPSST